MPEPREVRAMFDRIAHRYDLLNRLLSAGVDRGWRRVLVERSACGPGTVVVDACSGTGDLALAFAERGARVVGVDFAGEMVRRGEAKREGRSGVLFAEGDALRLPVCDDVADVASIAFGLRNLGDRRAGIRELARVVRPGGCVLVLEFSPPPKGVRGRVYGLYLTRVLPRVGAWISGDPAAYRYLPDTVLAWPTPPELAAEMESEGLVDCGYRALSGGIASLSWGSVSGRT